MGSGASIEELTSELEQDFNRVVPRTPRGSIDVASCDRGKVRAVVDLANSRISAKYKLAWDGYALSDGAETPVVGAVRDACAALIRDFDDKAPRCALPTDADAAELIEMASDHGPALHKALRGPITNSGGAYLCGPQKKVDRITEKARADYNDDVARVVDVERATGVYDSLAELNHALTLLREAADGGSLTIRRCKDGFFSNVLDSGYRDLKFNVEVSGFVGELQLNLRQILQVKDHAHKVYDVDRAVDDGSDDALRNAIVHLDLESEQVLRLALTGDQSAFGTRSSVSVLASALAKALPSGCELANIYKTGDAVHSHVRLGVVNIAALATLRDAILFEDSFERAINLAVAHDLNVTVEATDQELEANGFIAVELGGREIYIHRESEQVFVERPKRLSSYKWIRVDRAAFLECYARIMMHFTRLTPHQRNQLEALRDATVAVLLAPAGGGKTFVAVQRVLHVLNSDPNAVVLFTARTDALALFACKWLVIASRKSADRIVSRIHVLVAPFARGPRSVRVEATDGRQNLVFDETRAEVTKYALIVVDEAHHLVRDVTLYTQFAEIGAAEASVLFLGDASQSTATMHNPEAIARSLVELPQDQEVVVATLSEVVRSTKRIVAGAAAFQLAAGAKAETSTHAASAGPPLVARIFGLSFLEKGIKNFRFKRYAQEVVKAIADVRRHLEDLDDLDDRIAVVCPDDEFVARLRSPLYRALAGRFDLVDAATASAALPRGEADVRAADGKEWLLVDNVDNVDGLERLVVICVGLDQIIDGGAVDDGGSGVLQTRSRLYRAMTRAQLAVAVVNSALPGGWLEFLGRVELDADGRFDEAMERRRLAETAADGVVGTARVRLSADMVSEAGNKQASQIERPEAPAAPVTHGAKKQRKRKKWKVRRRSASEARKREDANRFDFAAPSADKKKIHQAIWDTSGVTNVSTSRGDLRFVPFFDMLSDLDTIMAVQAHSSPINCVDISPDGQRVVSAGDEIEVWDVDTGKRVATLDGHSETVKAVFALPDGQRLVSGSDDKTLRVWDLSSGRCIATLEGHSNEVSCVIGLSDGRRIVSGSDDGTLKVWDVATGECVATLEGHSDYVRCGVHCTSVLIWLRRRSAALRCFRTGGASCLGRTTTRSRSGT